MSFSKFHRSGIMTGYVDYFCFACEKRFNREEDANLHRDSSFHQNNLETIVYWDKYKGENIRKVKSGYYCEYCNIYLNTSTKVGMHVKESSHINKKGSCLIKQQNNYVLANNRVMLDEKAWHGINEETCAICNTDFDDEKVHKNLPSHSINLVGIKVEFGINDAIYRHIDIEFFQCLTCNLVYFKDQFEQHFDSSVHRDNLERCLYHSPDNDGKDSKDNEIKSNDKPDNRDMENVDKKNTKKSSEYKNNKSTESDFHRDNKNKILYSLSRFQNNDINIDFLTETAFCKKCNASIKLDFNHIVKYESKNNSHCTSKNKANGIKNTDLVLTGDNYSEAIEFNGKGEVAGALDSDIISNVATVSEPIDIKTFAKDNKLTYNPGEANAYCTVHQENLDRCLYISPDNYGKDSEDNQIKSNDKPDSRDIENVEKKNTKKSSKHKNNKSTESDFHRDNKNKIPDCLSRFQKNDIDIDSLTGTAFCKKCSLSIKLDFNGIENHVVQHDGNNNSQSISEKQMRGIKNTDQVLADDNCEAIASDAKGYVAGALDSNIILNEVTASDPIGIKSFTKQNNLTYNPGEANAYCRICKVKIPSKLNNIKEHVKGRIHQKKMSYMSKSTEVVSKIPTMVFIESGFTVVNILFQDVVINEKYCLSQQSLHLITDNYLPLKRCNGCSVTLTSFNYKEHIEKESHMMILAKAEVITRSDGEFLREIRPGLYHCGYCNLLILSWEEVKKHMVCFDHLRNKNQAAKRLRSHLMKFEQLRIQEAFEFIVLRAMMRDIFN